MKVFTNENNPILLKFVISAEISGKHLDIETVSVNDKRFQSPKRLPVLFLESEETLFSSNAAILYLYPPLEKEENEVKKWLEWEALQLMPFLFHFGNKKTQESNNLKKLICHLESHLQGKSFLVGNSISAADISVWSSLFPIHKHEKYFELFLADKPHIKSWVQTINSSPPVVSALAKCNIKDRKETFQGIVSSCWYPDNDIGSRNVNSTSSPDDSNEVTLTEEDLIKAVATWEKGLKSIPIPKIIKKPVLPVTGENNILITSALPYVNNVPHLGNIIGCVLSADAFARYCRLRNWNTLYICGTDEYGTATETKAIEEKLTPKEICDKYFTIHSEIYSWFNISFDFFGRTTSENQKEAVQDMFNDCHRNGYTKTAAMDQLLCEKCNRFLADRFVEGTCPTCKFEDARGDQCDGCGHLINAIELINARCKVCHGTPVVRQSQQLFLDLPKIEPILSKWIEKSDEGWTHNARLISKAWLKDGLKPRCITRDLKWGIPVPLVEFENKVFYVWFDAPIGYMSMTKGYTNEWLKWWQPDPNTEVSLYQFMAKDNVPFHSIMFPATLLSSNRNYVLVKHLMATEYLNYEDGKFSKSRGVGIFGNDAKDTGIPSDIFRFYLLYIRPESQDSSFSWNDLATKNNSELLNNFGNFVNRALMFTEKFFDSTIKPIIIEEEEKQLIGIVAHELNFYNLSLTKCKLRDGIRFILNISRHGNVYMQSNQPWALVKGSERERERAGTVVSLCCNMVALLAALILPYMPETAKVIIDQLGLAKKNLIIPDIFVPVLTTGHKIGKPFPLFSKIEQNTVDNLKKKYAGTQQSKSEVPKMNGIEMDNSEKSLSPAELETAVAKQGDKVRLLKSSGADKSVWQPEVQLLLKLKKSLSIALGNPVEASAPSGGKKGKHIKK